MPDPIRLLVNWPSMRGQRVSLPVHSALIIRQDPIQQSSNIIARHELSVWFEPNWYHARALAKRFPHCLVYSIPTESDTPTLRRLPGWRPRPNNGVV